MKLYWHPLVIILSSLIVLSSCGEDVDTSLLESYQGPTSIAHEVELWHSDSAIIRTNLKAQKQLEFANGNFEFPEGIEIYFFDEDGNLTTTMTADRGYYVKKDNIYRGDGDVQVSNLEKDQKLSSEELFWDPNGKIIYTEKFVTVQEKETLFNGTGMEADEGFNDYKLFKVTNSRTVLPGEGI
jgi:LPS export ABC transporter protein LptC